jgi:hypothetical protein
MEILCAEWIKEKSDTLYTFKAYFEAKQFKANRTYPHTGVIGLILVTGNF